MSAQIETFQSQLVDGIRQNSGWAIAIGVLSVITGFLAIMVPYIAGLSVTVVVGALLSVNGVSQLIFAFKTGSIGKGVLTFALGVLATGAGFYMMFNPGIGLLTLTLLLAAYFCVAGISEMIGAWQMKPVKGWVWALISGAASLLLGILIWRQFPLSGEWAVGILTGIRMIFGGVWVIAIGRGVRGAAEEVQAGA